MTNQRVFKKKRQCINANKVQNSFLLEVSITDAYSIHRVLSEVSCRSSCTFLVPVSLITTRNIGVEKRDTKTCEELMMYFLNMGEMELTMKCGIWN